MSDSHSGRRPPKLATWLVKTFSPTRHARALAGDLLEEFHSGRSRAWYWRQTALIVLRRLGRQVFSSDYLAGSLVIFGGYFLFLALIDYAFWRLTRPPHLNEWVEVALLVVFSAPLLTLAFRAVRRRGWSRRSWLLAWFVFTCFGAWDSTEPFSYRLRRDAIAAAISWVCVTIYGAARHRRSARPD